jgi:DNA invertase Pin-like site-specific DNA recombinase
MPTVLGGLAEFERDLIRARTGEGRARAVARGVKLGRPHKLAPHQRREATKRRDRGDETLPKIGRSYNISLATISRLTDDVVKSTPPSDDSSDDAAGIGSSGELGHYAVERA